MYILSIETSCDETAVSVVAVEGTFPQATYTICGDALFSQIDIHREFGGVFPAVAKREHINTIVPMITAAIAQSAVQHTPKTPDADTTATVHHLLTREPGVAEALLSYTAEHGMPQIDLIAVTTGPGLEPALWVGINTAKALGTLWGIPIVPVDHMEGHILASLYSEQKLANITFPAISLLVSGGHTEFILMRAWGDYTTVGSTRDDAVGEAFDKVARILGLPYPGGPEISRLAEDARARSLAPYAALPHPMLHSQDLDFSFSGLKTAVRYAVADKILTADEKAALARDFEDAAITVLIHKTKKAIQHYDIVSVIVGGGVSANKQLRAAMTALTTDPAYAHVSVYLPERHLSTDNSIMIALAGDARRHTALSADDFSATIRADGNKRLVS